MNFGGISTVSTGDLNGDGLFDLVVGKTNGRIAVALNTGTKTEPKFGAPAELKGDRSQFKELWLKRVECVVQARDQPAFSASLTGCLADGLEQ